MTGGGPPSHSRLNPQGNTSRSLRSTSLALLSAGKATPFARRLPAGATLHPTRRSERAPPGRAKAGEPVMQQQQQLKEGACCLAANSKVICKVLLRVSWVRLHKRGFAELCDMRTNETPLAAGTHKLSLRAC